MFDKIKKLFKKEAPVEQSTEGFMSGVRFKDAIKALGMEVYKGVTIVYLEKPSDTEADKMKPIYHFWIDKEFYFKEADSYEELQRLAQEQIDSLI